MVFLKQKPSGHCIHKELAKTHVHTPVPTKELVRSVQCCQRVRHIIAGDASGSYCRPADIDVARPGEMDDRREDRRLFNDHEFRRYEIEQGDVYGHMTEGIKAQERSSPSNGADIAENFAPLWIRLFVEGAQVLIAQRARKHLKTLSDSIVSRFAPRNENPGRRGLPDEGVAHTEQKTEQHISLTPMNVELA